MGKGKSKSVLKQSLEMSYQRNPNKAPSGYTQDKHLSSKRVQVYKKEGSNEAIIAHRGSQGLQDWKDNAKLMLTGNIKKSKTYKMHKKKHDAAVEKYGADNITAVGHSRAGKYVEELNKERKLNKIITYNKAATLHDIGKTIPKNQTDIRTHTDLVSLASISQHHKGKTKSIAPADVLGHSTKALN